MKNECIRMHVVQKVNMGSTPSELRFFFFFFFEGKESLARKLKKIVYVLLSGEKWTDSLHAYLLCDLTY